MMSPGGDAGGRIQILRFSVSCTNHLYYGPIIRPRLRSSVIHMSFPRWYLRVDSNLQHTVFETVSSASWDTQAYLTKNGRRDRERFGTPQNWETDFRTYSIFQWPSFNVVVRTLPSSSALSVQMHSVKSLHLHHF